jgi:hypothetical protein
MKRYAADIVGVVGLALFVSGVALVYRPAALILAGLLFMGWAVASSGKGGAA